MTPTPIPCIQDAKGSANAFGPAPLGLRPEPVPVSAIRRVSAFARRIVLRLSIARGIRKQKIARQIRSADVKRGLARKGGQ